MKTRQLDIVGGMDRSGVPEPVTALTLRAGETLAVVGPTGSGKSELLSDIEQLTWGDTPSGRMVLLDGRFVENGSTGLVATLSQRTNFIMDADVATFIRMHVSCLGKVREDLTSQVLGLANSLCGEPISAGDPLQGLSGGQTRALMIADIALVSDAPVVLIDEVENAGIDKHRALAALAGHGKIIVTATHDPVLMLMNSRRVIMRGGGMQDVISVDEDERRCLDRLLALDAVLLRARETMRRGERLRREVAA
jgi:ABC-type lipoprotein export system ATPase subunit